MAAAQGNEGTTSPSRGSVGGACAEQNTAPYDGALATAAGANDAYSRLERRLEAKERAARGDVDDGVPQLMASVRRKIQFLEECDRSVLSISYADLLVGFVRLGDSRGVRPGDRGHMEMAHARACETREKKGGW